MWLQGRNFRISFRARALDQLIFIRKQLKLVEKQCARPFVVGGEKARVHNLLGIAFWYTIAQNDGGLPPIILSYSLYVETRGLEGI